MMYRVQRLFFIPHIAKRWLGPISMAIYMKSSEDEKLIDQYMQNSFFPQSIQIIPYFSKIPTEYPYNKLRNLALKEVTTSHFWVMDMDMWPSSNLYTTLLNLKSRFLSDDKLAIIVPSFEYKENMSDCTDLEECVKRYFSL